MKDHYERGLGFGDGWVQSAVQCHFPPRIKSLQVIHFRGDYIYDT
uniref:Uncharacterized protein n=1 Tax=Nelumbo nucifera TaxID=4432 RepID=A0A822ZZZ4_NELNU|nr:TPA_asm: hypothetical protein HUJ06_017445 [Nelumbo nucifera]